MKYLKKFETEQEAQIAILPNVSLINSSYDGITEVGFGRILGVYIQHIDGTLYTKEDWVSGGFASKDANGVAYGTLRASFVISKEELSETVWSSDDQTIVEGIPTEIRDDTEIVKDFDGLGNTSKMLKTDVGGAAYHCDNYIFPNGQKGYLASAGEWIQIRRNYQEIESAMELIGVPIMSRYWTSSQWDANSACYASYRYADKNYIIEAGGASKSHLHKIRPFTQLRH